MTEEDKIVIDQLESITRNWLINAEAELQKRLDNKKLVNSGQLKKSFFGEVQREANTRLKAYFGFEDYGRIRDMKNVRFNDKQPPIKKIEDWIDKVGIEKFKYVPGYKKSKTPIINIPSAKSRIAWAIVRDKVLKKVKEKSRKWYGRNFWIMVSQLENELLESVSVESLKQLTQNE